MLRNNYRSRNLIGHYPFWVISPRNSTSFTRPFLAGRRVWAGHETRLEYGHIKLISCFWSVCGSIFSELLDLCNQYSACSHSVDTTCTQWLHRPSFGSFDTRFSAFCSLVSKPYPPQCILLFVYHFLSTLVSGKKKKPGGLVIFE